MYLQQNKLEVLHDGVFTGLKNLIILKLGSNYLITLPETIFEPLANLQNLYLNNNNLKFLPKNIFANLLRLAKVDLSSNALSRNLPKSLYELEYLHILILEDNLLSNLGNGLEFSNNLSYFQKLDLSANMISGQLPSNFFNGGLNKLRQVLLSNNKIMSIESGTFDNLPEVKHLDLGFNYLQRLYNDTIHFHH